MREGEVFDAQPSKDDLIRATLRIAIAQVIGTSNTLCRHVRAKSLVIKLLRADEMLVYGVSEGRFLHTRYFVLNVLDSIQQMMPNLCPVKPLAHFVKNLHI